MKRPKKYKKGIKIEYLFYASVDNQTIVDNFFDRVFSKIIQDQKRLVAFLKSDEFKVMQRQLNKRKSILSDYLSIH